MGLRRNVMAALVSVLVLGVGGSGAALTEQTPGGDEVTGGEPARSQRKSKRRGPRKVIEMDTLEVLGKVQKPRVFLLIGRGELKYEGLPMDRDLLKEVEDTVKGPPF